MDLRSPLGKVKGLGAAKSGTHHWWMQRVTAVALIPLVIWFVIMVIQASISAELLLDYMSRPLNAVALILFIGVSLYHGCIGMRVIIEDYVHCPCGKIFILTLINFVTVITAAAGILAVVYLHVAKPELHRKIDNPDMVSEKWEQDFQAKLKAVIGGDSTEAQ